MTFNEMLKHKETYDFIDNPATPTGPSFRIQSYYGIDNRNPSTVRSIICDTKGTWKSNNPLTFNT